MPAIDPYAVLGLWPGASQEQIKRAYRRAVKKCHPDVDDSPKAREDFLRVQMAYEMLSGNPFYSSGDVIHGNGWTASREEPSVDFSPRSANAYKVRMARESQSVQSPFYRAGDKAIKVEDVRALTMRQIGRTLWYAYMAISAGASVGFIIEGIIFLGSGKLLEGVVAAGVGIALIVVLALVLGVSTGSRLFLKS